MVHSQIRVIYADTDAMGQAYYGNYLKWFEIGRAELFRSHGMSYHSIEEGGVFLPVIEAHCQYLKPAFYDDVLIIGTFFSFESPARLRFDYELQRESNGDILTRGYTVHVCTDKNRKMIRPPAALKAVLESAVKRQAE
ncbi:MAG: acyl-CoA thioesterase [Syntrophobacteraceae bacterium]|jgi:acyl-CoA thioester hydrolase